MKAITLTEPWASLVAIGAKRIETRSWDTSFRGPIAIHAAKGMTRDCLRSAFEARALLSDAGISVFPWGGWAGPATKAFRATRGCVVATARLAVTTSLESWRPGHQMILSTGEEIVLTDQEFSLGAYGPGRYGFFLTDIVRLSEPIPAKGTLGLWEWEPPVEMVGAA